MRHVVVAIALLFAGARDAAAEDDVDPIDIALTECLNSPSGESTQGMVECLDAAYQAWDKALNDAYRQVIEAFPGSSAALLKTAQRQWLGFRDAERDFLADLETTQEGTIWRITTNQAMVDMVKARVLLLRSHIPEEH